ncbi:hypothetical protein A2U01_0103343, partial [Trifolium medium]|nr:hypothetical protein [Trifolium medium]
TEIARLTEERKKLQEELGALQLSMTPVEEEDEQGDGEDQGESHGEDNA